MNKIIKLSIFLIAISAILLPGVFASAQYYTGLCIYHSYQRCNGNSIYWYDSCGNQQDLIQYCSNGCSNGVCNNYNNYYNYSSCNYHAYKDCAGSSIYWFDSCSNRQDLYQNCSDYGLTCQYGQCVSNIVIQKNDYKAHYNKVCYKNSVYWYDSLGVISGLYQNCSDSNSCTTDSCKSSKCFNILKCDGSTCIAGTEDYNKYCGNNNCENGNCESNLVENKISNLSISFFTKKDFSSQQWDKTVQLGQNENIYFMVTINNNSNSQIENVIVSVNIPSEISYLGNLKIDDVAISGDIVSGINAGSIQALGKKSITFEGKTQTFSIQEQKQASAFINSVEPHQSDSISINFDASQSNSAAISSAPTSEGIMGFLKRWFMWIIAGIVLISLFVVVFRRLSSNV